MSATCVFGFTHDDLESASVSVERALGIRLEPHDSLYIGPYYRSSVSDSQSLQLRHNADPIFDERSDPPHERFSEPDFPDARLLLYLHGIDSARAHQLLAHVEGILFLAERKLA